LPERGSYTSFHRRDAPLTVTIITPDGRSRSARIEVEAGRGLRMMN
jgi:hypothetical protein